MKKCSSARVLVAFTLSAVAIFTAPLMLSETSEVVGTWRGESVCLTDAPACHNENVVYYISDSPNLPDQVVIRADKILAGKAITMGTGPWRYDRTQHTLEWATPQQTWRLRVVNTRIEGTLTLADKTVFRSITLQKDK